jgi:WD40 repeat protein
LQRSTGPDSTIRSLAFSADGSKLAVASSQGVARIWDLATNRLDAALTGHTAPVTSVAFLDNDTLATGSDDRSIRLSDLKTG